MDTSQNLPLLLDTITTYSVFIQNVNDDNEVLLYDPLTSLRRQYENPSDSFSALLVFNGVVLSGNINLIKTNTFIMKNTKTNKGSLPPLKFVIESFIDDQRQSSRPTAILIIFKNGSVPQQDTYNLREVEEEKIKSIPIDSDSVFGLNIHGGSVDDILELLEHIKTKYVAEKKKVNSYEFDTIFMSNVRTNTAVSAQDGNVIIKINTSNYLEKIASTIAKPLVPRNIVTTVTSAIEAALGEETLRDPMYIQFRKNKYKKLGSLEKTGKILANASKKIDIDPILLRLYDADMSVVFQGNVNVIRKKGTEFVVENPDLFVANNKTFNNCHVLVTIARVLEN